MNRELNTDACIRAVILLGFSVLLLWLAVSGKIIIYINPRYTILSTITGVVMFFLFLIQASQVFIPGTTDCHHGGNTRPPGEKNKWSYLLFTIPLLLAFLLPTDFLDPSLADKKGINLNPQNTASQQTGASASVPAPASPAQAGGSGGADISPTAPSTQGTACTLADELRQAKVIHVTDKNFVPVVVELNQHYQDYLGKEITMLGFIYRDERLSPRQFGLLRYVITCCAADASPGGVFCEYKDAVNLKEGSWITIRGTIGTEIYENEESPVVKVTSITPAAKPKNPYVYP